MENAIKFYLQINCHAFIRGIAYVYPKLWTCVEKDSFIIVLLLQNLLCTVEIVNLLIFIYIYIIY